MSWKHKSIAIFRYIKLLVCSACHQVHSKIKDATGADKLCFHIWIARSKVKVGPVSLMTFN